MPINIFFPFQKIVALTTLEKDEFVQIYLSLSII
ncbi:hypothetical protein J2Y60_003811 [Arcicella sp. BE140]|nr:hypothetical protein [Arcicella sp. BE51]MDR6813599.1 hypothetical protein [Arcicella sp. BE140]MDR6824911.1 hypothetical protein [Arcicella sp. BE139]